MKINVQAEIPDGLFCWKSREEESSCRFMSGDGDYICTLFNEFLREDSQERVEKHAHCPTEEIGNNLNIWESTELPKGTITITLADGKILTGTIGGDK